MNRNERKNSYQNNRGARNGQRSEGGQSNEQGEKSQNKPKKKVNFKKDKTEKLKAVMAYKLGKCGDKMSTKFRLYSDEDKTSVDHQTYTGTSKYKLIKTIQDLWKMIDENELLPHDQDVPRRTP